MPGPKKPVASNADRGLERHVNPDDPTGPLLEAIPNQSHRFSDRENSRTTRKRRKKINKTKRRHNPGAKKVTHAQRKKT